MNWLNQVDVNVDADADLGVDDHVKAHGRRQRRY